MKKELINAIAFTLFLQGWLADDSIKELDDETIKRLHDKWVNEWLPSLNGEHCGDCTKVPAPCTRCHTEAYLDDAERIARVL